MKRQQHIFERVQSSASLRDLLLDMRDRRLLKNRKRRPEGVNESRKFSLEIFSAAIPKSPPNTQSSHRDVHDPSEWVDVPRNTATPQSERATKHSHRTEEQKIGYSAPVEKK